MDRAALHQFMLAHRLRRKDVALLLDKPLNSAKGRSNSTVDSWLSGTNPVPRTAMELLRLKVGKKARALTPWQGLAYQHEAYPTQREFERDLSKALDQLRGDRLPQFGRVRSKDAVKRLGYLLELTAMQGGNGFEKARPRLLQKARKWREQLAQESQNQPTAFRAGAATPRALFDDLAARWGLASGTDLRRFRQLARTGHV